MSDHRSDFIALALRHRALRFGDFTLKSGRRSPYFFNAGELSSGAAFAVLGRCYAAAIAASGVEFDMLFGPAYKGIPLAVATAVAIAGDSGRDVPCAFDRKEAKTHGEGGALIGAPLAGRVLIVDDVITAGTAVRSVARLINAAGARIAGVALGLDRAERGAGTESAVAELASELGVPVFAIARLDDIVAYLEDAPELREYLPAMLAYRREWGAPAA
ncbi:MAG: Orotate phosphoribosyltransferase [Pseudomonadales bacterium]|nr:Orotate phosphoribosyltransferase [Pseudomonadales bacterium]